MEKRNRNKGIALITVLAIFSIIAIFAAVFLNLGLSETKQVMYQEKGMKAYYTARSGADAMASYIEQHQDQVPYLISQISTNNGTGTIDGNPFQIKVACSSWPGDVTVYSTGTAGSINTATVTLNLNLVDNPLFKYTVFSNNILSTGKDVEGDIGTNQTSFTSANDVKGNVTLGPGATSANILAAQSQVTAGHTVNKLTKSIAFPPIDESQFTTPYNGAKTITISGGSKLYLWTNDFTDELTVTGVGQVHLLVKGKFDLKGNPVIQTTGGAKLYIYYPGYSPVDFKGTPSFDGLIYAPNATVDFSGGGTGIFFGAVISNNYIGPSSSGSKLLVDNDLDVEDIKITNNRILVRGAWSK